MNKNIIYIDFYNQLKNYLDEVGYRIVDFDKSILEDEEMLHEFVDHRAEYAASVMIAEDNAGTVAPREVAISVLMDGYEELKSEEEEVDDELNCQSDMEWRQMFYSER